jgi:DNA-binding IclR family transcriptional regulator
VRPAGEVVERRAVRRDHPGPRARLDGHVADRHAAFHRQRAHGRTAVFDDVALAAAGTDLRDDPEDQVLGGDAGGQLAGHLDGHRARPGERQGLRREDVLHLAGADAERESAERAVGARVAVAADDRHAGLGEAELRTDDVHDALAAIPHRVQPHPELRTVLAQRLDLRAADEVDDRPGRRRDVVVLGRDRELGAADPAAGGTQPVERLRTRHLVDEVQVDVEQVRLAVGGGDRRVARDDVGLPHLLGQRAPHDGLLLAFRYMRRQYRVVEQSSGVGVLDKAVRVLAALEAGPAALAELVTRSGLARPTAYRIAVALEHHRLVERDAQGRFALGPRVAELAGQRRTDPLEQAAGPVLARLRAATDESAQLYRREGEIRRCVAAAERLTGLRDTVPVGAELPMTAGSAAQVLLAWEPPADVAELVGRARFAPAVLTTVRRRGWAASVAEREAGVASVSAPVFGADGSVVAAVSVSGPIDRLTRQPGRLHAAEVVGAARALSRVAGWRGRD